MTMQRLKRGDLSRINPRRAPHTDVYQPAPVAAKVQPVKSGGGAAEVANLQNQLNRVLADNKQLAQKLAATETALSLRAEENDESKMLAKREEELRMAVTRFKEAEAKVAELEAQEHPKAQVVDSVRIHNVQQVRSKDTTMRIDCTVEPTEGPLAAEVALYLTVEEGAKLRLEEEPAPEEVEEPEEEGKDDNSDEDQ